MGKVMIDYRSLLAEAGTKNPVVFAFIRANPPTSGHGLIINAVLSLSKKFNADHFIYVSHSQDAKKNPLNQSTKISYLRSAFPSVNFVGSSSKLPSFIQVATHLNKTYKDLIMVSGSDRVSEFKKKLDQYNGKEFNFDSILVVSAGDRDPDSEDLLGMSATKMRAAAANNDFSLFEKGVPSSLVPVMKRKMFDDVRSGMMIKEDSNIIREQYINEEIFKVGDIALLKEDEVTVKYRGSNYVIVEDTNEKSFRVWLSSLSITNKINESMKNTYDNQLRIAQIIGMSIGLGDSERLTDPSEIINKALLMAKNKNLNIAAVGALSKMLQYAKDFNIKFDTKLGDDLIHSYDAPEAEDSHTKIRKIMLKVHESDGEFNDEDDIDDDDELSDDELDKIISDLNDDDIIEYAYDDDDFEFIDDDDEEIDEEFDTSGLNEIMTRAARLRAKSKMVKSKARRVRGARIALKKRASPDVINRRARRAAIKVLKMRIAKKPVSQMGPGEKERVERRLSGMKGTIGKLAMRMIPKVRKIEKDRLGRK